MTDGDALLKAVLAHPDHDAPRLIYADWLDENGHPDRAKFIREAIAYPHCAFVALTAKDPFPLLGLDPLAPVDIGYQIPGRKGEPDFRTWMWGETDDMGCVVHDLTRRLDYREDRGFIDGVRCTAADWLAHASAILASHPVRSVILTTVPRVYTYDRGLAMFHLGPGREVWQFRDWMEDRRYSNQDVAERLLGREWPSVRFQLPSREPAVA